MQPFLPSTRNLPPARPPQLPPKRVLALGPEEVNVRFELQLEDMLLVDAISFPGDAHTVAQQGEAGQGIVILEGSMVPWGFPSHLSSPPLPWGRGGDSEVREKGMVGPPLAPRAGYPGPW